MNWRLKSTVQNVVARLPFSDAIYYALQRTAGDLRPGREDPREWLEAAAQMVGWLRTSGADVVGKDVVEIGTGRRLHIPVALWLLGARRVLTVDLHRYLSGPLVEEGIRSLRERPDALRPLLGVAASADDFDARLAQLLRCTSLAAVLETTGIEYHAPADARRLPVPDASFDLHVSHVVLQHVPPAVLVEMLAEARRVLRPSGCLVHFIDLSDMFSHDDPTIPAVHFLRFSDAEWQRLAGNRFMYTSRLRPSGYHQVFAEAGLRVLDEKRIVDEPSLALLKSGALPVDRKFAHLPPEELAARHLRVLALPSPAPAG